MSTSLQNKYNSIGVFDSGVGGLTLLNKLAKALPIESFEYFGDSGNCPYGHKNISEIQQHTMHIMDFLMRKKCKLIAVACNTITTNIIEDLRAVYKLPIIGMEPGTKPAYIDSNNKRIGVLATEGTLNGELYHKTLSRFYEKAFFLNQVGENLVELIEKDLLDSEDMVNELTILMKPMIENNVDTLVLGCTHYNFLSDILIEIFPYPINIIDTTDAVTAHLVHVLNENDLSIENGCQKVNLYTTGSPHIMRKMADRLHIQNFEISVL